jgi:DNA invertase Pin-like site-specific DNA recombinase
MRTAIYCRVSTPGQKNTTSLPEQERLAREHAARLRWEVSEPHVYCEVEGGEDLYRPCMDRLWEAIIRHEIDGVIVDVLDRLSRDEGDQGAFYHHCDRYGVAIDLASEDIDESENGRNLRTLAGISARMERADIRRRTQRGRRARAALGKLFPASFPLYGYLFAPDTGKGPRAGYIVDPETAPVVIFIYERVADGVPIRTLAKQLEADGVPTPGQILAARGQLPKGKTFSAYWRHGTILRILHHPAYVGQHSVYRWQTNNVKTRPADTGVTRKVRQMRERAMDDAARVMLPADVCPALVSPELAARVQARLTESKAASAGRNPDPLATLWRGMTVCGHCGGRLNTGQTSNGRRYACFNVRIDADGRRAPCPGGHFNIAAHQLDPAGWADVVAWLSQEKNVARLLAHWREESRNGAQSIASRIEAADAQLRELRDKMGRLAETIAETSDRESRRVLQEKLDTYADRVRAEEARRERLLGEARGAAEYDRAAREIREWVQVVRERAATASREEKRDVLRALDAQVTVWRGDYAHPDDWPQRYKIVLRFTGFTGQPVTLPPQSTIMAQTS